MIGCVATPPTTTAYNERFSGKIDHMLLRTLDTFLGFYHISNQGGAEQLQIELFLNI